jgi:hypothetical protein
MSLATVLSEDRRLVILRSLSEVPGFHLNEDVLRTTLNHFGHNAGRDLVRADIDYLVEHRLARVEKLHPASGELWLVHLTGTGDEVAQGRPHVGIARLGPA